MPSSALRAFASLYRELTKVGCPPPLAKTMEVWQAAVSLGVGWEAETGAVDVDGVPRSDMNLLRQRLAASQGLAEPPEAKSTSPDDFNAMMNLFSQA